MRLYSPIVLLIFLFVQLVFAQELPPIQTFTPQDYNAEDQNWSISQANNGNIYIANNRGLLEYNGSNWNLYETPNKSIVRSVKVHNDKIYTGFYMDFGYYTKDDLGQLVYHSLTEEFKIQVIEDEEFWNIFIFDNLIVFQSLDRIYVCNTSDKSFVAVGSDVRISRMFKVNDDVYFQQLNRGLFKIVNGEAILVSKDPVIYNHIITNIFNHNGALLIHTKENGFYLFEDNQFAVWNQELANFLDNNSVYSSLKLSNGSYILGTVSNGLTHLNNDGKLNFTVNQTNGLANNTVLSLFEDTEGNIWVGLDNGINVININSPFKEYIDNLGVLGTVYASIVYEEYLFLGTNQGLFYKPLETQGNFNVIEGTNGQVWNLQVIDNQLFCSHDKGTFIIENLKAKNIFSTEGTWKVAAIPGHSDLLIQGNYDGLHLLKKNNDSIWEYHHKLSGFNISSRYFEFLSNTTMLVSHEYKGVYTLTLNDEISKVEKYTNNDIDNGIKSSLATFNNNCLYSYNEGVFKIDRNDLTFLKDSVLSSFYQNNGFLSGKLRTDPSNNRLWMFAENSIGYVQSAGLTNQMKLTEISLPADVRKTKPGFENILHLSNQNYLIGTTKGYIVLDLSKIESTTYDIVINQVINYQLNEPEYFLTINRDTILPVQSNNLRFSYSTPNYNKFLPTKYSYKLDGFNQYWSQWSNDSEVLFENLPHGSYKFKVKSKVGNNISSNMAEFDFVIKKPWHLSNIALLIYFTCLVLLTLLIHNFYTSYYKKQRNNLIKQKEIELEIKDLENQKQLMQFKNKTLQQDVEIKNKELGISTMNLIKKNELLGEIKKEITDAKKLEDLKRVLRLINKNINNTDDWKAFEEAFNNADKDFLKKVKNLHPNLTSNDLKICAYLRLNLTSKEIAPLLNISTKSVEVKRYRLRKKMNLDRDVNLTNYILDL
jgi:ligand-binding sensor domain-containing protein/DNA-binding CsgD family transcriptional regulator